MEQPFPTVKPLNREQQKVAFNALKQSYSHEVPPTPPDDYEFRRIYHMGKLSFYRLQEIQKKKSCNC
jgi:hypothetical protein